VRFVEYLYPYLQFRFQYPYSVTLNDSVDIVTLLRIFIW